MNQSIENDPVLHLADAMARTMLGGVGNINHAVDAATPSTRDRLHLRLERLISLLSTEDPLDDGEGLETTPVVEDYEEFDVVGCERGRRAQCRAAAVRPNRIRAMIRNGARYPEATEEEPLL